MVERSLYVRLLSQSREDFHYLRWHSCPVYAQLVHRATNAEAEGVVGVPVPNERVVEIGGAGHREFQQRVDERGRPKLRADPIVDVNGKPITNSAGEACDVAMPAFRTVAFGGATEDVTKLREIAERAGRLVAKLRDLRQMSFVKGWSFSRPRDLWWALLFEMAWANEHPLLVAERRLWLPAQNPSTFVPYDLSELNGLAGSMSGQFNIPSNWLKRLPEAWVSQIDNVTMASLDAADCLLNELDPGRIDAGEESSVGQIQEMEPSEPVTIKRRFAVALSFPGEHRTLVETVANALERALRRERVFYDKFHEVELAGLNLDLKLERFYSEDSDLVVVFVCREYNEKEWCGIEWRSIRDLMKKKSRPDTDVMFVRLDDESLPGLLSIDGYLDVGDKSGREIADAIIQRWSATR